ncbi:hypothetical protein METBISCDRAFT_16185 [Metschnikowia bicuspidata]|uniref:PH domain-containing protein n=1 Tax=Metschnikowia bicuspidata TaxID=27322 RepID=A0A4P9ZCF3_9ASCO|nr:hypothetical protein METBISCDRAFT_16185 [Metschnikowia bicuspidata]
METLDVHSKDFLVKWVTAPEKSAILWQIKPLKRSINYAIYRKKDVHESSGVLAENSAEATTGGGEAVVVQLPDRALTRDRLGSIWTKLRRGRLALMASVNSITERTPLRTMSRLMALSSSLNNPDWELLKNYHKLVPGELVKGLLGTEPGGTFAFVVDNTFSKTTSKTVLFSSKIVPQPEKIVETASTRAPENSRSILHPKNGELMQGVLQKKRRKKLQGFTNRFFILNFKYGTLSYFKVNDNKLRGQMPIAASIVSANDKSLEIFIDSGMEVWNLKAPSAVDFKEWVNAFNILKMRAVRPATDPARSRDASASRMLPALRDLHLDLTDILADFGDTSKDVLELQLYSLYSRFSDVLQIRDKDASSVISGEFFDAHEQMNDDSVGVVLMSEPFAKSRTDSFEDVGAETRSSSDLDSDFDDEQRLDPAQQLDAENPGADNPQNGNTQTPPAPPAAATVDLAPLPIDTLVDRDCDIPVFNHDPPSFLLFVRKNVGNDLLTLSMPVDMNEPITIVQKYAEMMEYSEMIDNALLGKYPAESGELILRIAAFAVTYLAAMRVKLRIGRKPFNPLLGETYELVREDKGFRYLCEKVSHKPPVFAVHVEAAEWVFSFSPAPSQKFWGKTSEIYTNGTVQLTVRATQELFTWSMPNCVVKNIIAGEKYFEPCSPITVKSSRGQRAVVEFSKAGMFSGRSENLVIKAYDASKRLLPYTVTGKWTDLMTLRTNTVEKEIWTVGTLLPQCEKKFCFPTFTGSLNKITVIEKDKSPCTDSRYRPDMRVYTNGDIEKAEMLKQQLEERQRERRKAQEDSGLPHQPRFFRHVGAVDGDPCSGHWEYIKGEKSYWKRRLTQDWGDCPKLW